MAMAMTLREFMDAAEADYEVFPHGYTECSSFSAELLDIPGDQLAKAVILGDGSENFWMAVIPASHKVDLGGIHRRLEKQVGLATEDELNGIFVDCSSGAIPALGQAYGLEVVVEEALGTQEDIYFEAGTHMDTVHVSGSEFARLMKSARYEKISRHM